MTRSPTQQAWLDNARQVTLQRRQAIADAPGDVLPSRPCTAQTTQGEPSKLGTYAITGLCGAHRPGGTYGPTQPETRGGQA